MAGNEIIVTNGIYATGGRALGTNLLVNSVAVHKPLTLRSVNGPEVTIIQGYQVPITTSGDGANRCVHLTNGATLSGFTLTNGCMRMDGEWFYDQSGDRRCAERDERFLPCAGTLVRPSLVFRPVPARLQARSFLPTSSSQLSSGSAYGRNVSVQPS